MTDDQDRMECQICERKIKAKSGLIAHHGYTRPTENGWTYQTQSCAGARELPYEKSCELIPPYINAMTDHKAMLEAKLIEYLETPPATITRRTPSAYQRNKFTEYSADRPDGFTTENAFDVEYWKFRGNNYPMMYRRTVEELKAAIKDTDEQLVHLQNRVNNWEMK